jgi:hypothetical protein
MHLKMILKMRLKRILEKSVLKMHLKYGFLKRI